MEVAQHYRRENGQLCIDPEFVATHLGLTPMEGRVAAMLAEGHLVPDIVEATGCSRDTVWSHLKRSYNKLGISGQAQLVRDVLLLCLQGVGMPSDRAICIKNTGDASISIVISFRGEGRAPLDLEPGNAVDAEIGDGASVAVALNDVKGVVTHGQFLRLGKA